tara:strand:+ start:568 stop:798 length:231 start_codon:yes stop_codon:yes gene_type:complete
MRCPEDMRWLHKVLITNNYKAYIPSISVKDPKNRKKANEISDWCKGEGLKLWSDKKNQFIPNTVLEGKILHSTPTN